MREKRKNVFFYKGLKTCANRGKVPEIVFSGIYNASLRFSVRMNMARLPTHLVTVSLLAFFSTALGCGVMPAGQGSARHFTLTGFTLPVAMVYSPKADVPIRVPGIAANQAAARGFVQRLVMQTVIDVLEGQGRGALLPDAVISAILGQLSVNITYEPLECEDVAITRMEEVGNRQPSQRCIIVGGNTVTGICSKMARESRSMQYPDMVKITDVPVKYTTISGTVSTTNIIMANWSKAMWQSVLNRAVRMLASGPFRLHFFSASATVGGN
ncbi:hypothetical protein KIN20_025566 [Parelaphostrongylus tenuis]|uniref:Uncharacterized protein n=1 Tax=Parelaphostrongylus tenuis TaxID=148309 RepID=A0AAD5MVF2_PARTN|nr:hypothetical protein KIN20_025566 [Parelaphostrongylus tenuis]